MDEAVSPAAKGAATLLATLALLGTGAAGAQALNDPTRPPAAALPGGASAGSQLPQLPQLQSVLVGRAPGGRRIAVIDGETVRQGGEFRGARVARVGDSEVELVRGRERQVLRLYEPAPAAPQTSPAAPR